MMWRKSNLEQKGKNEHIGQGIENIEERVREKLGNKKKLSQEHGIFAEQHKFTTESRTTLAKEFPFIDIHYMALNMLRNSQKQLKNEKKEKIQTLAHITLPCSYRQFYVSIATTHKHTHTDNQHYNFRQTNKRFINFRMNRIE